MNIKNVYIPKIEEANELNVREKAILRTIIHLYILNATPVGSRSLSKYLEKELKLSPATIRNIMADLEEMEYISHPHTSAGRIPTDKGYRFYVDSLMNTETLTDKEIREVKQNLNSSQLEHILKDASKVLGMLSKYLGIVQIPQLSDVIVQKIELILLTSNRLLVVIALDSNIVRTVTLELEFEIDAKKLEDISIFVNERVSGRPLRFLRENFQEMFSDFQNQDTPLIRVFVESVDKLFGSYSSSDKIHIAGTPNLLKYPEFEDFQRMRSVIELIENEDIIIHILEKNELNNDSIKVMIGGEIENQILEDYSLVLSNYTIGSAKGSIGLIGPKRMNYSKVVSLVKYVSDILSKNE